MSKVYQLLTDKIIAKIEECQENGIHWTMCFNRSSGDFQNAITKKTYHGSNILMCALFGNGQTQFATYKQWQSVGGQVKKGAEGLPIVYFELKETKESKDKPEAEKSYFPLVKYSTVFGADQVILPDGFTLEADLTNPLAGDYRDASLKALDYAFNAGAVVQYGNDGAYYVPSSDYINMPHIEYFRGAGEEPHNAFASVLLHELTHWTGHKDRLNRLQNRDKEAYAFEELVAELGAAFQCHTLGVSIEPRDDHAHYLASWLKALRNDNSLIFKAAAAAEKAVTFIKEQAEMRVNTDSQKTA